jgi:hypothetical protein
MQRQWAREQGIRWDRETFEREHPLEMARRFRPEVVFLNSGTYDRAWVRRLKEECPRVRLVVGWWATDIQSAERLRGYDLVLTSSPALREEFRRHGLRAALLRHAFDPRVLGKLEASLPRDIPFSFVGQVNRLPQQHKFRGEVLERLLRELDISVFSPRAEFLRTCLRRLAFNAARLARRAGISAGALGRTPILRKVAQLEERPCFPWEDPIARRSCGARFGLAMFETLARSQVTLNVHIGAAGAFTGNIRMFEATGVGTCLLTDWKADLPTLFEPDREVVAFRSPEECAEKARWLLERPAECAAIGREGQRRTLAEHSYRQRVGELDGLLRGALNGLA